MWSLVNWFSSVGWFHHLGDDWKGAKKEAARELNEKLMSTSNNR